MVEYHVDICHLFQDRMNERTKFGGNLSVRLAKEEKPLLMYGHDESIFKQYLLTGKSWIGPNGEKAMSPKDEGQGVMISAFQSRHDGFGMDLTKEDLKKINQNRSGERYFDEEAAKKIYGKPEKAPLEASPFVVEFEFGINNDGYWCYDRMVLQLEDCVDALKTIYPQFDFLFLFDHSCGHDKQRPDGLNAENMSKNYGGKQNAMRPTVIKKENGYLGPFERTLSVGDTQFFNFQPGDTGPFWLCEKKRGQLRRDTEIQGQTLKRNFTKAELTAKLQEKGILGAGSLRAL